MTNLGKDNRTYSDEIMSELNEIEELKLNGEYDESIKKAEKLLIDDPNCVAALEEIADNYVNMDEYKKAEKACIHALKLDENSYTAKYILGFIASQKQEWDIATKFLKAANELHPNNPEILRCLGWSTFNTEKRTQGVVILERALNIDPENSLTLCDLGICYLQIKNFEKSVELLKRAVEIDPDNKRIQECYNSAIGFKDRFTGLKRKNA